MIETQFTILHTVAKPADFKAEEVKIVRLGKITPDSFELIELSLYTSKKKVVLENKPNMLWVAALYHDSIVGCATIMAMNKLARFKCDIVHEDYQKCGIYERLFSDRLQWALDLNFEKADAFASPYSIGTYLRYGFQKVRQTNNQPTFYLTKQL